MEFLPIKNSEDQYAIKIFKAYCEAFPANERRNDVQFDQLFSNEKAEICIIINDNKEIGYLILWNLKEVLFVEHFEIFPEFRSQSFGSKILEKLITENPKVVLESEPSHLNEIAERRIKFYQRNHFSIISEDYIQPSYGIGKSAIPLFLLATFQPESIDKLKLEIYDIVYQF